MIYNGRVGFMGAHSTGKTTVAKWLMACPDIVGVPMLSGHARRVATAGGAINEQASTEAQSMIMMGLCADIMSSSALISDRTPIDVLAYTKLYNMPPLYAMTLESMAIQATKLFDHLFYFPIAVPLSKDGVRSEDVEFQQEIDARIRELIKQFDIPATVLKKDDLSGLTRQVKRHLKVRI